MARIVVDHIHVRYPILQDQYRSMRRAIMRTLSGGKLYKKDTHMEVVHALHGVSFTLENGDRLGLIGRNGAGKSTLLKTLGGFILPESGDLNVTGNITSLFSVAGGMDDERTGYDNIFLTGRLLGISRAEMTKHLPDIEEFSELGEFLSVPVRAYSDGMKIRLGFAVCTCLTPDILLLDEAIGAGDAHFVEKASKRAQKLYDRSSIMVIASHAPEIITSLCNKVMWLDHGRVMMIGPVNEVMSAYMKTNSDDALVGAA